MFSHLILAYAVVAVLVSNLLLTAFVLAGRRAARVAHRADAVSPDLAMVRPIRGLHARSDAANRALVHQRYGGKLTCWFVATRHSDPGFERARRDLGSEDQVRFLSSRERDDATDKACNMIDGWKAARAPFIGFCDADIELPPDALQTAMSAFDEPEVAGVFAPVLYQPSSFAQRVSSLIVSSDKLVSARALDRLGLLSVMEGGLMIVRRSALEAIGPIEEVLSETIADDLRLATALVRGGGRIRATAPIQHPALDPSLAGFLRQYHRWMVCVRSERPSMLLIQVLLHPVAIPLLAALLGPRASMAWMLVGGSVVWRIVLSFAIARSTASAGNPATAGISFARPFADLMHFAFGVAALVWPRVRWAGREYNFQNRTLGASPRKARVAEL